MSTPERSVESFLEEASPEAVEAALIQNGSDPSRN